MSTSQYVQAGQYLRVTTDSGVMSLVFKVLQVRNNSVSIVRVGDLVPHTVSPAWLDRELTAGTITIEPRP